MSKTDPICPPGQPSKALMRLARGLEELGTPGRTRFLLRSELSLIFRRRRNQLGLAVLALVPIIIAITVRSTDVHAGGQFIGAISGNGMFVALSALTVCLPLFLPIAVATISADAIAGEASAGTLRYLLTAPVGRARLLGVKSLAVLVFTAAATLVIALTGLLIGWVLFPIGKVTLLSGTQVSQLDGLLRLLAVCGYLTVCLLALAAVGLFFSTLTDQPLAAALSVMGVTVLSAILGEIPQLDWLHPYLLTHHWMVFGDLLRAPIFWDNLRTGTGVALGYIAVFSSAAWAHFTTKDITS